MKRLSLNVWNDWSWIAHGCADLTLIRASAYCLRGGWTSATVVLLGFGASLTWYAKPAGREHGA